LIEREILKKDVISIEWENKKAGAEGTL